MSEERDGNSLAGELISAVPWWLRLVMVPFKWLLRRREDPVKVMELQEVRKAELREGLDFDPDGERAPEAIVIRTSRRNRYPNKPARLFNLFASDWFKVEVKEIADQTLDVYSKITQVKIEGNTARETFGKDTRKVFVVGKIPLESIRYIRWRDDPGYNLPRLYIDYGPRGPAREVAIYCRDRPGGYLFEQHGIKFKPKRQWPWTTLRMNWQERKQMKP